MGDANAPMNRMARRLMANLRGLSPMPAITIAIVCLLVSVSALAALSFHDFSEPRPSGTLTSDGLETLASMSASGTLDTDLDGIPDAVENFVTGSNSLKWNTSGSPLPDGWLFRHGHDLLDPSIATRPAAHPPAGDLPSTYANQWPARFTPTLWDIYSWGRPTDWDEATTGPFDNGIDPTRWDNSGDGVPDGWLIHYGLDPLDGNVSTKRLAGPDGLSVREAFQHNTDTTKLDSDGDGLADREEIDGPTNPKGNPPRFLSTDPSRFSTAQSGVCDGYLVAHGLDPNDPANSYQDLAHSGATTLQKFQWSKDRFGDAACRAGRGLDPTKSSSTDGLIPDGWLLRYGLDPLDAGVPNRPTQSSRDHADGPWLVRTLPPDEMPELPHVDLTVLNEYRHGRPTGWNEAMQGPWWGGTDPTKTDTDGDGLPDSVEIRGYYIAVATDVGHNALVQFLHTVSDPTTADTDGDGLTDFEEVLDHGTDPARRDTDMDGIPDAVELSNEFGLDPLRADSAEDFLRDGVRLEMLESRSRQYLTGDFTYDYPGEPGRAREVTAWACQTPGAEAMLGTSVEGGAACAEALGPNGLAQLFGPGGNLNGRKDPAGNPIPNIRDPDIDGDVLLNGWEVDPSLYIHSPFGEGPPPRPFTDPLNPDTDGDKLPDGWEVKHGEARSDGGPTYYNLDPSLWDSNNNGVSDAEEDPDVDSIEWVSFVREGGGATVARRTPYLFPNLLEWQQETNPNLNASDRDGLGDAWKVFWSTVYAGLGQDQLGLYHPPIGAGWVLPELRPRTGDDQSGFILSTNTYQRFVLSLDGRDEMEKRHGEKLNETYANIQVPGLDGDLSERTVYRVNGTIEMGFKEIHDAGTNPYLEDTSGDGIPDWWSLFYSQLAPGTPAESRCVAGIGLDPLVHYAATDTLPTDSGLTIRQEYLHGTNPLCKDTDMDGLSDGYEVETGLDPLDPSDAGDLAGDTDSDGDGVPDSREIVGYLHGGHGGIVRTNHKHPDADGDGLLDGDSVVLQAGDPDDPWIRFFLDLGVPYQGSSGKYTFFGEADEDIFTSPLNPDDSGTGVPSGWLQGRDAKDPGQDYRAQYSARMPTWWNQAVHGPWWGGVGADGTEELQAMLSDPDLDNDGLRDVDSNGDPYEDPMPFANSLNAWPPILWDTYPSDLIERFSLPDPANIHPTDETLHPIVARLLAQSYLYPKTEGAGGISFSRPSAAPSQVEVCLTGLAMLDGDGAPATSLFKGVPMDLTGRVIVCDTSSPDNGNGFPGVTVEVRLGSPPQVFGAGFTDDEGRFLFSFNVSKQQRVELPPDVPVVLRGRTSGTVEWPPKPANVIPGQRELIVQTYASPPYTGYRPALASATNDQLSVTVKSGSILELTAPDTTPTGPSFKVQYQLLDSSGTPLRDDVRFEWLGQTLTPPKPDLQGRGEVSLKPPHEAAGLQKLVATSHPSATDLKFVDPANANKTIQLLNPIDIRFTSVSERVDAGQVIDVQGQVYLVHSGQGVPNLAVNLKLVGAHDLVPSAVTATGPGGTFHGRVFVPAEFANGEYPLLAQVSQGESTRTAQISREITVRSLPRFWDIQKGDISQGDPVEVSGRLRDQDARPVAGANITLRLHNTERTSTTDDAGRFLVTLPGDLPVRPVLQTISFAGDRLHAPPVPHRVERAVLADSSITIPAGSLARGASLNLPIKLVTHGGDPVKGAPVQITWGNEDPVQVITDASGQGIFRRDGHADDALGPVTVRGNYAGSRDGGVSPSPTTMAMWSVNTRVELHLPQGVFEAGRPIPLGILRDAGTREPLANTAVTLAVDPGGPHVVTTDPAGRFQALDNADRTSAPRRVHVTASFAGNEIYGPMTNTTTLTIRTPTTLAVNAPPVIVTGRAAIATVHVHGLDGAAVDDGLVNITLGAFVAGSAKVSGGVARISVLVPDGEQPGPRIFTVEYRGSDDYAPATTEHHASIRRAVVLSLSAQPSLPGQVATVYVTLTSNGEAVAFASVYLQIEGLQGGLQGTTDKTGVTAFSLEQPLGGTRISARFEGGDQLSPAHAADALHPVMPVSAVETAVRWMSWIMAAVFVTSAALAMLVYRSRRSPLAPIMRQARRIITTRGPHAQKILEAYRALQDAAIGSGFMDRDAQTPRLLQAAIMPHVPTTAWPDLGRLMDLFEITRYAAEPIGPGHRGHALDALKKIEQALRADAGLTWWQRTPTAGRTA